MPQFDSDVIEIIDNPLLTSVNLDKFNFSDGIVRIQRNPLLDVSSLCSRLNRVLDKHWHISDACEPRKPVLSALKLLPGIPHERLMVLSTVKKIAGCLSVRRTNLETLSFFQNLEEIDCRGMFLLLLDQRGLSHVPFECWIHLKSLNKSDYSYILDSSGFQSEASKLEGSIFPEFQLQRGLPSPSVYQWKLSKISENLPWDACVFNSQTTDLITISRNCTSLIGFLHYENRTIPPLEIIILNRIRHIYGNIKLVNVSITDLSMFSELERVISLDGEFSHLF
ncbi:unnamed protein product [Haemonchus placei]|uniref:Recep_L_domain domain-containing protein n=1 Tax=Haemonchus placei TaxID=6290 RepID=A0A0N4VUN4_HAEPC|nr:unnamed protein product [Haemonchus placei]